MPLLILELEERLIEEAVRLAVDGKLVREYHREREQPYDISDPEDRNRACVVLHDRWFRRLDLGRPIRETLDELPIIASSVALCRVITARRSRSQGAELYVSPGAKGGARDGRRMCIQLCASTLSDPAALERLLRRELLHIADMLDPVFAYEPALPKSPAGPTHDRLLMERYSAVWAASVTGRLVRRGHLPPSARDPVVRQFCKVFPTLQPDPVTAFDRFFEGERPTHPEMVALCQDGCRDGSRCGLCSMPTYAFEPVDERESAAIRADYPQWQQHDEVCPQCVDLYRATAG